MTNSNKSILEIKNLKTHFPVYNGLFMKRQTGVLKAVDGVSFSLQPGDSLGLVGESGCGKSTIARTIIRLLEPDEGKIIYNGQDISHFSEKKLRPIRTEIQLIFQDPYASLNPRMTVYDILAEPIIEYKIVSKKQLKNKITELMNAVGLSYQLIKKYPHEFSGGQRQRVAIARALSVRPKLLIADEPVSALDVSIQAQILNLISDLKINMGLTLLFISHNLAVVRYICNKTAVIYSGKIVEIGETDSIFKKPSHPYTKSLISAVPLPDPKLRTKNNFININNPNITSSKNKGCIYFDRCPNHIDICREISPELIALKSSLPHSVACHLVG